MIRNHGLQGNPKRRIAVIQIPRPQRARMGSVGPTPPPATAWTTISDEPADSSANWISYVLQGQARTRETTPGTLNYTPASDTPGMNVAPWNSWISPNCPDPGAPPDEPIPPRDLTKVWLLLGGITALGSLVYIANNVGTERKR